MYNVSLVLVGICIFAIPILLITLIVQSVRKKANRGIGYALISCIVCFVVFTIVGVFNVPPEKAVDNVQTSTVDTASKTQSEKATSSPKGDKTETTSSKEEVTESKEETTKVPVEKKDNMITQFKGLGFTDAEAQKMKEVFITVGITEIKNIQAVGNVGIDKLQVFKSDIYDSRADKGGISIHFTIDKRQLCFIAVDGIATTKVDYAYINIFGNVKFKTSNGTKSVTLYDKWDENGEIDNNSIGYKAVLDYKNKKITNYE